MRKEKIRIVRLFLYPNDMNPQIEKEIRDCVQQEIQTLSERTAGEQDASRKEWLNHELGFMQGVQKELSILSTQKDILLQILQLGGKVHLAHLDLTFVRIPAEGGDGIKITTNEDANSWNGISPGTPPSMRCTLQALTPEGLATAIQEAECLALESLRETTVNVFLNSKHAWLHQRHSRPTTLFKELKEAQDAESAKSLIDPSAIERGRTWSELGPQVVGRERP